MNYNDNVATVRWETADGFAEYASDVPDGMEPAAGRHTASRVGLWRRTLVAGHEALTASAAAIAEQVDTIAEQMIEALQQRTDARATRRQERGLPDSGWLVHEVEVSFGIQLTGEATLAVFSGSTETSAQIVLKFNRIPEC
jgi:hypothetical protein